GEAVAPGLAGGVRRHVVVEHEALAVFARQRVDDLLVAPGTQRDGHQRLGLAAREQRRAVGARQYADANVDRTYGARVAAVDARLDVEALAAQVLRLEVEADVLRGLGGRPPLHADADRLEHPLPDCVDRFGARLLLLDAERLAYLRLGELLDFGDECLVLRRRLPVPCRLAGDFGELVDRLDRGLHLLVAVG